ncbi:MAG: DsbE family thiol:disulfide interchange protein [Gammaproteobacteria bacterium]|nr:DsbE family thiol:disulfide interchange protein [Gammaproteobacteria bacterium]
MKWPMFIPFAVFFVLAGVLARGLYLDPTELPSPLIDKPAPEFRLEQLNGSGAQFNTADMRGQVWMLNVWASWCVSCRDEHPLFVQLADEQLLPIVGLNYKDKPAEATAWIRQFGNPYAVIAADVEGRAGIDWGVIAVPETFLIDKQGMIRYKHTGPVNQKVMNDTIVPLIRQLQAQQS